MLTLQSDAEAVGFRRTPSGETAHGKDPHAAMGSWAGIQSLALLGLMAGRAP